MVNQMHQYTEYVFFSQLEELTSLVKHLDGKKPKERQSLIYSTYFFYKKNALTVTEGKPFNIYYQFARI
jgi:hypothetical protein